MLFSHGTFCFLTGDESLKVQQKTPGFMAVSHFHFPSVFDCSFSQIQLFFFLSLSLSLHLDPHHRCALGGGASGEADWQRARSSTTTIWGCLERW